jgi:anti-sigma regulatory factor (Ser/Thr protein kinase)
VDDLSLHILDVAENSVEAGATRIDIAIEESPADNRLSIEVMDDGRGMDAEMAAKALDPFVTTKKKKKSVGLGLPFFAQAARDAGGDLTLESKPGVGTRVYAFMEYDHIDRKPLGDMVSTIMTLSFGRMDLDIHYTHIFGSREFTLDTGELKAELGDYTLSSARAIRALKETLSRGEARLKP